MEQMNWVMNPHKVHNVNPHDLDIMSPREVLRAYHFHQSLPMYQATALTSLPNMAINLGLRHIFVKDESTRFQLNAFKVLGGSYAIARYVSIQAGYNIDELTYEQLLSSHTKQRLGEVCFYTATDGNHGRGVAWAAAQLNQNAVVFMPKGSAIYRRDRIIEEGGTCTIEPLTYDDCVRLAKDTAQKDPQGVVIQDTAWVGYEEIPEWIMQGYGTMVHEAVMDLRAQNLTPSHVFVQAGVGSLAAAVTGYLRHVYQEEQPIIIVVEASACDCICQSIKADDGRIHHTEGEYHTIMAGLACGEPNPSSYRILSQYVDVCISAPDWMAAMGMRILGAPLAGDPVIISGESGAVTCGVLQAINKYPEYQPLKEQLHLDENSVVLLFSTEGDTDPEQYQSIMREI